MSLNQKKFIFPLLYISSLSVLHSSVLQAQQPISASNIQFNYQHGVEQFDQGLYLQALNSLQDYLSDAALVNTDARNNNIPNPNIERAKYMLEICKLKLGLPQAEEDVLNYINASTSQVFRQRASFYLAQYYYQINDLENAIHYFELAGINNLTNTELLDGRFQLAYSYFNALRFDKAKPLFASIKELADGKYYIQGNYYYGLLSYNDKNYDEALKSFKRIHNQEEYKDIVPYYEAEIYYFKGDYENVLAISKKHLGKKSKLFYDKELHLLTAQTYFEQKQYKEALPYFEYFYNNSDKIRKEELYELAYTYYKLESWNNAIDKFQLLSNTQDSLGQTSMYLLGDCYLKVEDKKGARNAFGLASDMSFNQDQKQAAMFLFAKLSYELGFEAQSTRTFNEFVKQYPTSNFTEEARTLLSDLLTKSSNYSEAFALISDMTVKDNYTWKIYQKVAYGRAMQLLQNNEVHKADSVLNLSLQQPVDQALEAATYFWKSEIAYKDRNFNKSIQFSKTFLDKTKQQEREVTAVSKDATVQNAQLNIGFASLELEQYEEAQQYFAAAQNVKSLGYSGALGAEAILRQADAAFMNKQFESSLSLYDKAISSGIANKDYAQLQKALILGLLNKPVEKMAILNELIQKTPASSYKATARYESALTHIETYHYDQAIQVLEKLIVDEAKNANIHSKALFKLAYAYQQNIKLDDAIETYQTYVVSYPNGNDRDEALESLRSLFIEKRSPQSYDTFLKSYNIQTKGAQSNLEDTYYAAAENAYANNNWQAAIESFDQYLSKYPSGSNVIKSRYYRAESNYQLNNFDKATPDYIAVMEDGWNDFTELSALRLAERSFLNKEYDNAIKYYEVLANAAITEENLITAYSGIMRSAYANGDESLAYQKAMTLSELPNIPPNLKTETSFFSAQQLEANQQWNEALTIYKSVEKANLGAISVESRYRIASIYLAQNKLKEAEDAASYAIQQSNGYENWLVKNYILMADILAAQKDYFNAKATLQSIVSNVKNKALKKSAEDKLKAIIELEKSSSKLSE